MKHLGRFSSATGCLSPSLFLCLRSFSFSASSVVLGDCWKLLESSIAKRKEINLKHFSTQINIKAHRVEIVLHLRVHALVPVLSSFLFLLFSAYWMEKKEINWRNNEMKENTIDCYWMRKQMVDLCAEIFGICHFTVSLLSFGSIKHPEFFEIGIFEDGWWNCFSCLVGWGSFRSQIKISCIIVNLSPEFNNVLERSHRNNLSRDERRSSHARHKSFWATRKHLQPRSASTFSQSSKYVRVINQTFKRFNVSLTSIE